MNHIILVGFMGSGKSTTGKELARVLEADFVDTDERIEEETQMKISHIFEKYGEEYFRALETRTLRQLLELKNPAVISVGGGLPVREENRAYLKELGTVIYLTASVETLVNRLQGDTTRPMLKGGDLEKKILNLMEARAKIYEQTADVEIRTDQKSCVEIAEEIVRYVSQDTETVSK